MDQFRNATESHEHSLQILDLIYGYDSFLDSLEVICDMGCGEGLDTEWWANLMTRDDPPQPRNYKVYSVDQDLSKVSKEMRSYDNVTYFEGDFEKRILPGKVDLMWAHNVFQYVLDPLGTLKVWNQQMNTNGMLVLSVPQSMSYVYNRLNFRTMNYNYHNYNICNLVYMLAVNGFDCNDAYFYKNVNNNWIHAAVYKTCDPMDPRKTSLYDLAEKNLLHPSVVNSLQKNGYIKQEEIIYPWLDKDFYLVKT
jgi:SAM-dependent methyltransferase